MHSIIKHADKLAHEHTIVYAVVETFGPDPDDADDDCEPYDSIILYDSLECARSYYLLALSRAQEETRQNDIALGRDPNETIWRVIDKWPSVSAWTDVRTYSIRIHTVGVQSDIPEIKD